MQSQLKRLPQIDYDSSLKKQKANCLLRLGTEDRGGYYPIWPLTCKGMDTSALPVMPEPASASLLRRALAVVLTLEPS